MLCSVAKHAGSGRARKKCRAKHETHSSVFPHFLSGQPLIIIVKRYWFLYGNNAIQIKIIIIIIFIIIIIIII